MEMPLNASQYLKDWCKRLSDAVEAKETLAIIAMRHTLSLDNHLNPIITAVTSEYNDEIVDIVRSLKQVEGEDSRTIGQLLVQLRCPLRNVIDGDDSSECVDVIEHMIRLGSPVNETPDSGPQPRIRSTTALHLAVEGGNRRLPLVQLLLDNGADVHRRDNNGQTPLHYCVQQTVDCLEVMRLLVARGARVDDVPPGTSTLFDALHARQSLEVIKLLVEVGADIHEVDRTGDAVLHHAAFDGRRDVFEYLLEQGVDRNTCTPDGRNAVFYALRGAPPEFLRYLVLVCGVDMNCEAVSRSIRMVPMNHDGDYDHDERDDDDDDDDDDIYFYDDEFYVDGDYGWYDIGLTHHKYGSSKQEAKEMSEKIRFCLLWDSEWMRNLVDLPDSLLYNIMHRENSDGCLEAVLEHVAMRELMGLPVNESRKWRQVYNNSFCVSYTAICKYELASLMEVQFYRDLTLFNILTDGVDKMTMHVRNVELVAAFRRVCKEHQFLIYSASLTDRFDIFLYMNDVDKRAVKVLYQTLRGVLNYEAVEELAKRLSKWDLYKLYKFDRKKMSVD